MNALGNSPLDALLTLEQVAKRLNVSVRQVYRLIDDGKFPVIMVSKRSPRINPGELQRYLEACTVSHEFSRK